MRNWNNNRRLKRPSPLSHAESEGWIQNEVEHVSLACNTDVDDLFHERVFFKTQLCSYANKSTQHPEYLRQLALETIHKIPCDALQIYTDGSKGDGDISGSGVFVKGRNDIKICVRNPNFCSVFRSELIAIEEALKFCTSENVRSDIWILSDSSSAIQHLSEWWRHGDETTRNIVHLLNDLCVNIKIFFQWVPSHVNVYGNEIADGLAREGSHQGSPSTNRRLTYSEIASRVKKDITQSWKQPPMNDWYETKHPGASLIGTQNRLFDTCLARLRSGHIRSQRHVGGIKVFPLCPKCTKTQAAPAHLLACCDFQKSMIFTDPAKVLQGLSCHGLMDLI